jgi:hypothetical protein
MSTVCPAVYVSAPEQAHREHFAVDAALQISLFVKLKLDWCVRAEDRAGVLFFVGWVELIRAYTPVFAGYAKPIVRR